MTVRAPSSTSSTARRVPLCPLQSRTGLRALIPLFALALLGAGCGTQEPAEAASHFAGPPDPVTFPDSWSFPADQAPTEAANGMVSTTDRYATEVGLDILRAGGNAVDAAIATSFALAVVNPSAGNIGGGGFMVVRFADGQNAALDYREKAPGAAHRDMYLDEDGELTDASVLGHLASGVPGTVMGMWEAHRRFGTMDWEALVAPAVALAEGLVMEERLARSLSGSRRSLSLYDSTREIFLPGGEPPAVGDTFRQTDLAATLARIRDEGPHGFYRGRTADLIVEEMNRGGGIITHRDLEEYTAAWRDPVEFTYRGHTVFSMPPSSSGGVTMAEMANILEAHDLRSLGWHSPEMVHLLAESWKRSYSDRNEYLADPDYVNMPLARMMSKEYARERGGDITMAWATPSSEVGPGLGDPRTGTNTTHYSIVDADGNAVAVTTTINSGFGSKVTVRGAGFLLNNEMDDFAAKPGTPNQFGLVQGENNAIEPGKRMLSAMTPSIVLDPDGRLLMVTGTPGGSTIITTAFQTISNVIDFGMTVTQAVNAPRVHHQHLPDQIYFESGGLRPEVVAALEALG
ncbi:MAG: gamma-glutamyltransferase, partial [Gemmatimonadota bacterium]